MSYTSNIGYSNGYHSSSPLENMIYQSPAPMHSVEASPAAEFVPIRTYSPMEYDSYQPTRQYYAITSSVVDTFLYDIPTRFIGATEEVQGFVEEAFEKTMDRKIPKDIVIKVCNAAELKRIHEQNNGVWTDGIQGFSLNRKGFGINEIFVKKDCIARLLLTIGHEIGHVLTPSLKNAKDEEAKAFSFSLAWQSAIRQNNIAGIGHVVKLNPANNGIHNTALDFVCRLIEQGRNALEIYFDIIQKNISIDFL